MFTKILVDYYPNVVWIASFTPCSPAVLNPAVPSFLPQVVTLITVGRFGQTLDALEPLTISTSHSQTIYEDRHKKPNAH